MTSPAILNKIKHLLKLSASPNANEAETAVRLAKDLIDKHNVSPKELDALQDKPLYTDDEKVYSSLGIIGWRQSLIVGIANYFGCQVVQEELVPPEGEHTFNYYAYGDPEDVKTIQMAFNVFATKVEQLADVQCLGRGRVYVSSYCEGVVDTIKQNILLYGIDLPEIKRPVQQVSEQAATFTEGLVKSKDKPKPAENSVDVNSQSFIKDIAAFFKGVQDGKTISLDEILKITSDHQQSDQLTE